MAISLLTVPHGAPTDLVFNSMMQHMLHGRFDVDPQAIWTEAFVSNGRTYAYFGIFCALLRLPLFAAGHPEFNVTGLSIVCATLIGAAARLAAAAVAMRDSALTRPQRLLIYTGFALTGETIQYLSPSVYQEVLSWAAALASVFGLLVLRLCLGRVRSKPRLYLAMAFVAGLELLCRVSFGVGAYLVMAAVLVIDLWRSRTAFFSALRRLAPAVLVLLLAAAAAGGVNYARWGNPTTFMPQTLATRLNKMFPDRVDRLQRYGEFNIRRVPFALEYYFVPVFALRQADGPLPLTAREQQLYDDIELPPGSFFLSDAFVTALAIVAVLALCRRQTGSMDIPLARVALAALAVQATLMLALLSLTFRYRMDFYPAFDLAAFFGLHHLAHRRAGLRPMGTAAIGGLITVAFSSSLVSAVLYANSPLGPLQDLKFKGGWFHTVLNRTQVMVRGHVMPDGSFVEWDSSTFDDGPKVP